MKFKVFQVSASDEAGCEELNRFLAGHRVLTVQREFLANGAMSTWCFCVEYLDGDIKNGPPDFRKRRVDYKELLGEAEFVRFARMRARRKELAEAEGFPAYAVCTDEQLAAMARQEELTEAALKAVEGFGEATPSNRNNNLGFRVVLAPQPGEGNGCPSLNRGGSGSAPQGTDEEKTSPRGG